MSPVNVKQIVEGWRNNLIPPSRLKETIEHTGKERMDICLGCEFHSDNAKRLNKYKTMRPDAHCTNCGCTLAAKTKCLSCECPLGKWKAILTNEEEQEITEKWKTKDKK